MVAESAQRNVSRVAHFVRSVFSEQWKRLSEQAGRMKAQIVDDLMMSVSRSDIRVHRKTARCTAVLPNCLNAVKTVSFKAFAVSKTEVRDEARKGDVDR